MMMLGGTLTLDDSNVHVAAQHRSPTHAVPPQTQQSGASVQDAAKDSRQALDSAQELIGSLQQQVSACCLALQNLTRLPRGGSLLLKNCSGRCFQTARLQCEFDGHMTGSSTAGTHASHKHSLCFGYSICSTAFLRHFHG